MILADFTQRIADITGQFDANSMSIYARFVNFRYKMLWERMDWKDSVVSLQLAYSEAGNPHITLPSIMDRVISIRYGDHFLDPADETFFIETDPSMFERIGIPQYYQEETQYTNGEKQIRFWPIPSESVQLLIVGKKTFIPLTAGDQEPLLRNIDNCLLAFAVGDGYKRLRQLGKAAEQYKEAEALYQELVALEKQQSNVPRRTKNLTAAGNSLAEMTDDVCARCNDWLPDTRIVIKQFIRRKYQQVYDAALWPESLVVARVNSLEQQVVLPEYIERVLAVRINSNPYSVGPSELAHYFVVDPQTFERTQGPPLSYATLQPVAVAVLPPLNEVLSFESSDNNDKSNIMVRGESAGRILYESVQLNGTSPVYSVNPYETPLTIAKNITIGTVTIKGASSGTMLETLPPGEREHKHVRLWLQPHGTGNVSCLVLGKKRIVPLIQDEDTPEIRSIQSVLIYSAAGECFTKLGKADAATDANTQAAAALKSLLDLEINQTSRNSVVTPYVEPYPCEYDYDYNLPSK